MYEVRLHKSVLAGIQNLFRKISVRISHNGIKNTIVFIMKAIIKKFGYRDQISRIKSRVNQKIFDMYDGKVVSGPFSGMRLSPREWWGSDTAAMILGTYELEVLSVLALLSEGKTTFIDIGAANGYYAVGMLYSGLTQRVIADELSEAGREAIAANARRNLKVGFDKLEIRGRASSSLSFELSDVDAGKCIILVDIEGGEFNVITEDFLRRFRSSIIIVELHESKWNSSDVDSLIKLIRKYFRIEYLRMGSRDLSPFEEIQFLSDDERWLICSEGRGYSMRWLVLYPAAGVDENLSSE